MLDKLKMEDNLANNYYMLDKFIIIYLLLDYYLIIF
jgi:hypothetical protein